MTRYIVYGAGAIGSIIGASLSEAGQEVVLVGRAAHVEAICREGLQLHEPGGRSRRVRLNAVEALSQIVPRAEDRLLITLKAQQTADAVAVISNLYASGTPLVSFQNAVNNEALFAAHCFSRIYGGMVDVSGSFLQPGVVHFTRNNLLAIGRYPHGMDDLGESIATDLEKAGFNIERSSRIMELKWWKLVINTTNALLAVLDCWVQRANHDPIIAPMMADLFEEGFRVLESAGIAVQAPKNLLPASEMIARLRAHAAHHPQELPFEERTYPSTWQDLCLRRGSTEVPLFNGEIIRLGAQAGVPTPLNALLLEMVENMAKNKETPPKLSPEEMKQLFDRAKAV
jgi:2-dehydropantoate 2-reductase